MFTYNHLFTVALPSGQEMFLEFSLASPQGSSGRAVVSVMDLITGRAKLDASKGVLLGADGWRDAMQVESNPFASDFELFVSVSQDGL